MAKPRVLIIEDHLDTRHFLETMLAKEFDVISAENSISGIDFARNKTPNLILMDPDLSILNGYDVCNLLKKDERTKEIPIIFLSSKTTPEDIARGFKAGADDYIPKPFDFNELIARIQVKLRNEKSPQLIHVGDLRLDVTHREATYLNKKFNLTVTEFDILHCLARRAGVVVTREEILQEVWRKESGMTSYRTIDVHIRSLRRKIPELTKCIISVYGAGYKYEK